MSANDHSPSPLRYPEPELTDGVVRLRPWSMSDLDCVRAAVADARIVRFTSVPAPAVPDGPAVFIERQWSRFATGTGIPLAVVAPPDGRAVGHMHLGVRPQAGVLGLGYWVLPAAQGHGYASRAARLVTDWALDSLGVARVEAWVATGNEPSLRTLLAAGFHREGVLRSFVIVDGEPADAAVFSRLPGDQSPPRAL